MAQNDVERQVNYQRQQLAKIDTNIKPQSSSHNFTGNTQSDEAVKANPNNYAVKTPNKNNIASSRQNGHVKRMPQTNWNLAHNAFKNQLHQVLKKLAVNNPPARINNKAAPKAWPNTPVKTAIPKLTKNIQPKSESKELIASCITHQYIVELEYNNNGKRIVEVYCYGINETGQEAIRVYQLSGYSRSGQSSGYKMFLVSGVRNINPLTNEKFVKRPDYKVNDTDFTTIFCQVK